MCPKQWSTLNYIVTQQLKNSQEPTPNFLKNDLTQTGVLLSERLYLKLYLSTCWQICSQRQIIALLVVLPLGRHGIRHRCLCTPSWKAERQENNIIEKKNKGKKNKINTNTFFIPVLNPKYFNNKSYSLGPCNPQCYKRCSDLLLLSVTVHFLPDLNLVM